jgi:DsbC/DsbD-like thiol-disulfide interchange protein
MSRQTARTSFIATILLASFLAIPGNLSLAQDQHIAPKASSVVKPQIFASLDPIPRGREFQIAVVIEIARGYHMNSHHPSDAYLIPTTLTPQLPAGFQLVDAIYPDGHLQKFSFSPDKPLDVYSGSVTVKLKLQAQASAPLGPISIPMTLRYQACNDSTCLPPVRLPVEAKLVVGSADAKTQAAHPEIFGRPPSTK